MPEIDTESVIAIIPARGGSKRLPRKNILELNGRPMITYSIEAAQKSTVFDDILVTTDDQEIIDIAEAAGATTVQRPEEYATDQAHELDAVAHVLQHIQDSGSALPGYFCVIYPTAVLISPRHLYEAGQMLETSPTADVVMGASPFNVHPYKALRTNDEGYLEMMFPEECKMRSQFYPHVVASNGTFYWFRTSNFLQDKTYYTQRLKAYEIPPEQAIDIDTPEDFEQAQAMMAQAQKQNATSIS